MRDDATPDLVGMGVDPGLALGAEPQDQHVGVEIVDFVDEFVGAEVGGQTRKPGSTSPSAMSAPSSALISRRAAAAMPGGPP